MNSQKNLIEDIAKFVEHNRNVLKKGGGAELEGLDVQVASLCESVMQLSEEDRTKYADEFQQLLTELTQLGEDLSKQKEALGYEIRYLSSHKKASVAYKVADAKAPVKDDD